MSKTGLSVPACWSKWSMNLTTVRASIQPFFVYSITVPGKAPFRGLHPAGRGFRSRVDKERWHNHSSCAAAKRRSQPLLTRTSGDVWDLVRLLCAHWTNNSTGLTAHCEAALISIPYRSRFVEQLFGHEELPLVVIPAVHLFLRQPTPTVLERHLLASPNDVVVAGHKGIISGVSGASIFEWCHTLFFRHYPADHVHELMRLKPHPAPRHLCKPRRHLLFLSS